MPRADQMSQAEPPGAASVVAQRDLSHEESLAAALSSFLSQLSSCLDVPRLDETVDVTDAAGAAGRATAGPAPAGPAFPPIARSAGLKHVLPAGALEASLCESPSGPAPGARSAVSGSAVPQPPGPVATQAPARVATQAPARPMAQAPAPVMAQAPAEVVAQPPRPEPRAAPAPAPVAAPAPASGRDLVGAKPQGPAPKFDEQADIFPVGTPMSRRWGRKSRGPAETEPASARSYRRAIVAGALTVAVLTTAGLGLSLAWQRTASSALSQRTRQLAALENTLTSAKASLSTQGRSAVTLQAELSDNTRRWDILKGQLAQDEAQLLRTRAELGRAQDQLSQAQSQVGQAQSRAGQAQSRAGQAQVLARQAQKRAGQAQSQAGQAQGALGRTQLNLSATQANAADCQQGTALGQQTVQLLTSLVFLENAYLTAAQARDTSAMREDISQMQGLDAQAQALGPKFGASVQLCTSGR